MPARSRPSSIASSRPSVGIFVDCSYSYGRAVLRGIAKYANLQRRWLLSVDFQRVLEKQADWPEFDGVIVIGYMEEIIQRAAKRYPRLICCSGAADPNVSPIVALDDKAVGALAAEHLLNCRFRNFAYYGNAAGKFKVNERRLGGFTETLRARGFGCSVCEIPPTGPKEFIERSHHARAIGWLKELPRPLGVFAFDDGWTYDLAALCLDVDIAVPESIGIVGVNNDDLLCETAWPPLSSIDGGFSWIGFAAAQMLDGMLAGKTPVGEERVKLVQPLGVIQRQSTNVVAVEDPTLASAIRFIREHACDRGDLTEILKDMPGDRRWVEKQFAAQFERSLSDEVFRIRIESAKRLLVQSDLEISDISLRCGFDDPEDFVRRFRKFTKTEPILFRRLSR